MMLFKFACVSSIFKGSIKFKWISSLLIKYDFIENESYFVEFELLILSFLFALTFLEWA